MQFIDLCKRYAALRDEIAELDAQASVLREEADRLQREIIAQHAASGLGSSFRLENGAQIILSDVVTAKAVDKDAVTQWFIDRGLRDMLSVNHQTLTAFCKEEAARCAPLPTGVELNTHKRLNYRRQ